jgi:hypothetical protein
MKATKDKDGNISWAHENENPPAVYSGKPMEKAVEEKPSKMDKLKERAKELALEAQEEDQG